MCLLVLLVLLLFSCFFFFKQKTAYEMRISDWSSDVCSSDLVRIFVSHCLLLLWLSISYGVQCAHQNQHSKDGGGTHKRANHPPFFVEYHCAGRCIPQRRARFREPPIREQLGEKCDEWNAKAHALNKDQK